MKKNKIILIILIIILIGVGALIINKLNIEESTLPIIEPPKTANVSITEDGFSPETLKVEAGTLVIWTNVDSPNSPHRVKQTSFNSGANEDGFDSKTNIELNSVYRYSFQKPGTYTYHDELLPKFNATIIVE